MLIEVSKITQLLEGMPPEIVTIVIAMTPIFELRGSIPVAITYFEMGPLWAYFWSVLGNIMPVIAIIFLMEKVSSLLSEKFALWKRFFEWLFKRTRNKTKKYIEKYGDWGLFFLVAIPLPVTGGWTGALAAFLFGIKKEKAIMVISLGIATAGVIVSFLTIGVIKF